MKLRLLPTLVGLLGAYAALSVAVTLFGQPLAREHPAILSAFSFQEGPFSWSYAFDTGKVGPFVIGSSREQTIEAAVGCACFWAYPLVPNETRVRLNEVADQRMDKYFPANGAALLSSYNGGAQYSLTFVNGRLAGVTRSSFVFAGL